VVVGKLNAQSRMLWRYERNHPERLDGSAREQLTELIAKVATASTPDELMGIEGSAAKIYYQQFARMLTSIAFPGRKKRPSTDPANALLSLGYVMVGNEIAAQLEAQGFDPGIGFLHGLRYGRKSLALDVVEVFRQPVIDRLTLRLLNRRRLTAEDFEGGEGGLRLLPSPLKGYFLAYEEQLRSASEGQGSPTWREQIQRQVASLKEMVMSGEVVELYQWAG